MYFIIRELLTRHRNCYSSANGPVTRANFRSITRRIGRFSKRSHTPNDVRFFPLISYRIKSVPNVNIPYNKLIENVPDERITYA